MNLRHRLWGAPRSSLFWIFFVCSWGTTHAAFATSDVTFEQDPILFVIHPYKGWDYLESAKSALKEVVASAQSERIPFVYVLDSQAPVYLAEQKPTFSLMAPVGQFPNIVSGKNISLVGGNWGFCLSNALGSILSNQSRDNVKVTILTDATFIFREARSLSGYLKALNDDARTQELENEFQTVVDRWLKGQYCLTVAYEGTTVAKTKGDCMHDAAISLVHGTNLATEP